MVLIHTVDIQMCHNENILHFQVLLFCLLMDAILTYLNKEHHNSSKNKIATK